jgi:hypothetical protein
VKSPVALLTLFVALISVSCGEPGGSSKSTQRGRPTSALSDTSVRGIPFQNVVADGPASLIDKEAAEQAIDHWKPTKLGQSYYIHQTTTFGGSTNMEMSVCELRNPQLQLFPEPLSEPDKLNGTEWRGVIKLYSDAARFYAPQGMNGAFGLPPSTTWSQWANQLTQAQFHKINGKWSVDNLVPNQIWRFKNVEPSDLPKKLRNPNA